MPFMKGVAAFRRTQNWLDKGKILLKNDVRILTFFLNPDKKSFPSHDGLTKFIFWHLPQLKYQNPGIQMLTFKYMTPNPCIQVYLEDSKFVIDCDSRKRQDIHDHLLRVCGKTEEMLEEEKMKAMEFQNPANFGNDCDRQCMCVVPGQMPCPRYTPIPKELRGKYQRQKYLEEKEKANG